MRWCPQEILERKLRSVRIRIIIPSFPAVGRRREKFLSGVNTVAVRSSQRSCGGGGRCVQISGTRADRSRSTTLIVVAAESRIEFWSSATRCVSVWDLAEHIPWVCASPVLDHVCPSTSREVRASRRRRRRRRRVPWTRAVGWLVLRIEETNLSRSISRRIHPSRHTASRHVAVPRRADSLAG